MSQLNINDPPEGHQYNLSLEPKESFSERRVRLFKDVMLFLVAIGFVVIIVWLCLGTLQDPASSAEAKKWAMSVLSAATGGILGYLVRK